MIKVCYFLPGYFNNIIFDINNSVINRDDYAYSHYLFKNDALLKGIDVATMDINNVSDSDIIIYHDVLSNDISLGKVGVKRWLILFESEVISPDNWDLSKHRYFDKIFTWCDELVDNTRYFKINFSHKFPFSKNEFLRDRISIKKKKLCTLIAGNKKVRHPLELYSEREKAIRWFEKNAIDDFDLYGQGWNKRKFNNRYVNFAFSRVKWLEKKFPARYKSYKGTVDSKKETLSKYMFSICYENAQGISGYITEKIFDCFFAGCVPIYWGASNISDHIPKECFVDRRDFNSYEELYDYIKNMTEDEYLFIQKNISDYVFSKNADPYRAETFANTIVENILNDF